MEKLWEPPAGELIKSACNMGGKLYVFTDKSVYEISWPPKTPWYKKLWSWVKAGFERMATEEDW